MKIIKSDTGFLVYQKIFKQLVANESGIVAWQTLNDEKHICDVQLHHFSPETGSMRFGLQKPQKFANDHFIYFYCEEGQLIFKSQLTQMDEKAFSVAVPSEIRLIGEDDVPTLKKALGNNISTIWKARSSYIDQAAQDYEVIRVKSMSERSSRDQDFLNSEFDLSVDEEDKLYAGQRASPRARPKTEKRVKIKVKDREEVHLLRLFDLSRGGMSFVTTESANFPKGEDIYIMGFDQFDLDDPLIGTIMSHRPLDESQAEFKVGVKFSEGQE
jgi:hypothetical protein